MKYRIGITDYIHDSEIESAAFPNTEFFFFNSEIESDFPEDILSTLDALLVWHARIGVRTARCLKKGSIVVRYGVGFDEIDISSLTAACIPFCNTPDYGTEEVADTAAAMILAIQRKIFSYDAAARSYTRGWQEHVQPPLRRTNTQTLGILGVGRIGTAVINRMKPFGYRILGYDPYVPAGHEKAVGYERKYRLSDLLRECDIITVHCPLNQETRGLINDDFINAMKTGAAIVNTARGQILASLDAIETGLRSNKLCGAAFDVLPEEPPKYQHSLIKAWKENQKWIDGRLIINPHTGYYSSDALFEMRFKAAESARLYLEDGMLRNQVLVA